MSASSAQLFSAVYSSTATDGLGSIDLDELLAESRIRNRANGVTGMLLAEHDRFLQALEGPEVEVRDLIERIAADPRHHDVRILVMEPATGRRFPDWAMARGRIEEADPGRPTDWFAVLLEARGELPPAPTRGARLRAWFHGDPLATSTR